MKQRVHSGVPILLCTTLGLFVVGGFILAGIQNTKGQKLNQQSIPAQSTPTPTQTTVHPTTSATDPTAGWKTYTNAIYGLSFKYPQEYTVEEREVGFMVISAPDKIPQSGISIDARLQESYQSFTRAREHIETTFTISKSKKMNEWTTFDVIGKEDMLKGITLKLAIAPYRGGVIEVETIDNEPYRSIFDTILSTFTFTN